MLGEASAETACMQHQQYLYLTSLLCCAALLVPDIPLEETGPVRDVAGAHGLELVLLTTPTTPLERMEAIAHKSQGFVYLVSVTGRRLACTPPRAAVGLLCLLPNKGCRMLLVLLLKHQ